MRKQLGIAAWFLFICSALFGIGGIAVADPRMQIIFGTMSWITSVGWVGAVVLLLSLGKDEK